MNDRTKLLLILPCLALLALAALLLITFTGSSFASATCTPPGSGNWDINSGDICTPAGPTITLQGDLTINNGGNLTLSGVSLKMDATYIGQRTITVKAGGVLNLVSTSSVSSTNSLYQYRFLIEKGATATITDSSVSDCGFDDYPEDENGLYIASDSVTVSRSTFTKDMAGLYIKDASPKIDNSTFTSDQFGIFVSGALAKPKIYNCHMNNNIYEGVRADGSSPIIANSEMVSNGDMGAFLLDSGAMLSGNSINNNSHFGVYIQSGSPTVKNNTINNNNDGLRAFYSDPQVLGNKFINDTRYNVYLYRTGGTVQDNYIEGTPNPYLNAYSYGIYLCTATTTIKGNTIKLMKNTAMGIETNSNALIQGNTITEYNGIGVWISSSTVRFEGNTMSYSLEKYSKGLSISFSSGTIKNNTFLSDIYGIDASYINSSMVVEGNTFNECGKFGLKLFEASIVVKDNSFESNEFGLKITSSKPKILNNSFTDNNISIDIGFYTDVYLLGNNFMLNNYSINIWQGAATLVNNTIRFSNYSVYVSLESHVNMIGNLVEWNNMKGVYYKESDGYLSNNTFTNSGTGVNSEGSTLHLNDNLFTHDSLGVFAMNSILIMKGDIFSNNTFQAINTDSSYINLNGLRFYDNKAGFVSFASHLYLNNTTLINNEIGLFIWEDTSVDVHGLYISGSKEASVQAWGNKPTVLTVYFDDIRIYDNDGKFSIQQSSVVISNSAFLRGKAGIELTNGTLLVQDCTFYDMNATAISGQGGTIQVESSIFINNTMGLNTDTTTLTIQGSRIEKNNESGIQVRSTDLVLRDTRVVMNKDGIVELGKSSFDILDCNISSNNVFGLFTSGTSKFVKVNYTRKIIIEDNQFMIHGQMTVMDGAQLYLLRANVQFWSDTPGASGLVVMSGGQLFMRENVVSAYDPALGYFMRADPGSRIVVSNATIRHCGKGMSSTERGLEIKTDKADLRDIYFEDNSVGLFVYGTNAQAERLRFNMNQVGLYVMDGEAYLISSNFNASSDKDIVLTRSTARMLDTKFTFTKADVQDQGSILIVMWYLKVTVVWNDGQPVGGASVSVIDKSNGAIQSTTDGQGNTAQLIVKEYQQKGPDPSGYTGLSPHDVRVKFNGITVDKDQYIGASMTLTVPLKDDKPPIITVTSPGPGQIVYTSNVLFIGTAVDEGSSVALIELSLDGKNWFTANGTEFWSGFMTVPDGAHVVQVRGTDSRGNQIITSVAVEVDVTSPLLQILSPRDGTITNASTIKVYGLVHQGAKLLINGEQVHVDGNGTFSYVLDLVEGPNSLDAKAFGKDNQTMQATLVIIRDTIAPQITLLNPKAGAMVNSTTITVTVSANEEALFYINGRPVSTFGGKADTTVDLNEGPNIITVKAVDLAGNTKIYSFNVTLDTTVPSLILNKPALTVFRTTAGTLVLTGVTEPGANLTLNGKVVPLAPDGTFTYKMKLRVGRNNLSLTSKDKAGNANTISLAVTRKQLANYTPYYMLLGLLVVLGVVADVGTFLYFQRFYRPKGTAPKDEPDPKTKTPAQDEYPRRPEPERPDTDQRRRPKMPPPKDKGPAEPEFDEVNDLGEF